MEYENEQKLNAVAEVVDDGNEQKYADDGNGITATWDMKYIYRAITW